MAAALISLARDWPWGIDGRTARGLVKRGWCYMMRHRALDLALPGLTETGRPIAEALDREARACAGARPIAGMDWQIVDGGRIDA